MRILTYVEGGMVYEYEVDSAEKAREHASEIIRTGYRHNDGAGYFVHWPPHRIIKVKVIDGVIPTQYPDTVSGT